MISTLFHDLYNSQVYIRNVLSNLSQIEILPNNLESNLCKIGGINKC
jgi:hypothetical protein